MTKYNGYQFDIHKINGSKASIYTKPVPVYIPVVYHLPVTQLSVFALNPNTGGNNQQMILTVKMKAKEGFGGSRILLFIVLSGHRCVAVQVQYPTLGKPKSRDFPLTINKHYHSASLSSGSSRYVISCQFLYVCAHISIYPHKQ